jgi:hypothetical protein
MELIGSWTTRELAAQYLALTGERLDLDEELEEEGRENRD